MPQTAFQKKLCLERFRKIEFLEQQIGILRKDLERLEKTLEEVREIDRKVYGLPIA